MSSASPIGERARAIAQDVGRALGAAGEAAGPFRVRDFPAQVAGDVAWASVELGSGGALAVVFDDSAIAVTDGRLVGYRDSGALVAAIAAYVRGGVGVNAIEVVCDALPYVAARVGVEGSWWRANFWGYWDRASTSGASIDLGGDEWGNLAQLTQLADGIELRSALRWQEPVTVHERAALPALYERIAADAQAAVGARAAWRARPFSIRTVGERLLAALARKSWQLRVREHFPGTDEAWIGHGEHVEALLEERDGVVSVGGRALRSVAELEAALPELVAEIRVSASRLRADKLQPGATYRLLREIKGVGAGRRVTFFKVEHYPHDGGSRWIFGGSFDLWDQYEADCEILGALHEYLALDLPS